MDTAYTKDLALYIKTEVKRYFPDAKKITIEVEDETIHAIIDMKVYCFECGSDDNWYVFINLENDTSFTIPLMPE